VIDRATLPNSTPFRRPAYSQSTTRPGPRPDIAWRTAATSENPMWTVWFSRSVGASPTSPRMPGRVPPLPACST